jgi:hypothetical protein
VSIQDLVNVSNGWSENTWNINTLESFNCQLCGLPVSIDLLIKLLLKLQLFISRISDILNIISEIQQGSL